MNNLRSFIDKYNLNIKGYKELRNVKILDTDKGKYVVKKKNNKDNGLYEYLINKNFNYIIEREELNDYDIFPYIEEIKLPNEEKAIDLVYILSMLHNKTTFYREVVLDKVKEMYETLTNKINYLNQYYHELQDVIEQKVYMMPGEYLLLRNISIIYSALQFSKNNLESWYEYKVKQKRERIVLLHNKPSIEHLLISDSKQLISWEDYKRDIPIYDFLYFYKSDYMNLEMSALFDMYQSKFLYTTEEYLLFMTLISIPDKISFTRKNYKDCEQVFKLVNYVIKTRDFILKENKKGEKENEDKLEEQNNSI